METQHDKAKQIMRTRMENGFCTCQQCIREELESYYALERMKVRINVANSKE